MIRSDMDVCKTDDSHEIPSLILSEKKKKKKNTHTNINMSSAAAVINAISVNSFTGRGDNRAHTGQAFPCLKDLLLQP